MTLAKARRIATAQQRLFAAAMHMNIGNPYPAKSRPMSRRTARLWRGATITFK